MAPPRPPRAGGAVAQPSARRAVWSNPAVVVAVVLLVLGGLFLAFRSGSSASAAKDYQVGTPGVGAESVPFTLVSTTGQSVRLDDYRGKTALLYFHEGLGCQPCWDQIRDLQDGSALRAAGIDDLITITSGPADLIARKMNDDKLTAVALVDSNLDISRRYAANQFGMMGNSRNGHTFILVGPDGRIQWRADYGGAPNFTMYVAPDRLLSDLRAARAG